MVVCRRCGLGRVHRAPNVRPEHAMKQNGYTFSSRWKEPTIQESAVLDHPASALSSDNSSIRRMGRRSPSRSPARSSRRRHESSRRDDRDRRERGRSRSRSRNRRPPQRRESHEDAAPKTSEENGEISMSIEETNKLRISLGLKPLSLEKKAEKNVVNLQKTSAQVAEENEQLEIKMALEKSKRKRELTQKLAGQSIGEQLKATGTTSALDWVKQSRAVVAEHEKKAKGASKATSKEDESTYDAAALAGMTVGHDLDAFEEGEEVVLTLKDSRVLQDDGNDVNDDDDELVNVELSERDRREARQKQALRASMPVYSGFDDDEFVEMGGALKRTKTKKSSVLAHYDEDEEMKQAEDAKKFTLDAHGASVAKVSSKERTDVGIIDEEVVSLSMNKSKSINDFYTAEEMEAQFSKKSKKMRKKKKMRKVQDDGEDESAGAEDASALIQQLEEEAKQNGNTASDRGRRRRPTRDDDDEEDANLRRFQEAREKANAVAQSALAASAASKRKKRRVEVEDDVDLELSATLARARQIAQLKQHTSAPIKMDSEEKIATIVSQAMGTGDSEGDERMALNGGRAAVGNVFLDSEAEKKANAVVFNDATDFETRLRSAIEQRTTQFTASTGISAQAPAVSSSRREEDDMEVESDRGEIQIRSNADTTEEVENEGWADDQPLVGMGMGATLALLKRTGDLRESRVERQAGRANDARDRNVEEELRVKDGVKLDYRDEFGRLLTKKEAFRLLSYKFHGHKPGKKKQDKRLKQLKEELEAQKLLSGEGSTKMMKVLEKKQGQAKQAYVVLSNGT